MYSQLLTPAAPFQVDLSSRPVDVDYTPAKRMGYLIVLFGALFIVMSVISLIGPGGGVKFLIAGAIFLIGVMILRLGCRTLFAGRVVRFEHTDVIVTERGLLGRRETRAAYTVFKGVGIRRFQIAHRNAPKRSFQAIELQHDKAEAIALLVVEEKDAPPDALDLYARVLGVPALHEKSEATPSSSAPHTIE